MVGPAQEFDFTQTQKVAANLMASTFCNKGTEALLNAQSDLLKGIEAAMLGWLHRRQEAIEEAHRLVTRVRDSRDIQDIWHAQQTWATGAMQRFAADVATYPGLFTNAGRRLGEATQEGITEAVQETTQTVSEVARRAAEVLPKAVSGRAAKTASETAKASPSEQAQTSH